MIKNNLIDHFISKSRYFNKIAHPDHLFLDQFKQGDDEKEFPSQLILYDTDYDRVKYLRQAEEAKNGNYFYRP